MREYVYWITLLCMVVYYVSSISQTLCHVRKANNVRSIRYCTSTVLLDTMRFAIFFTMYFNESFGAIYYHLYYGMDLFVYAEFVFVPIVVSLYFAPELIYNVINGFTNKNSLKRILINMVKTICCAAGGVILVIVYLYMVYTDRLLWGMLPFCVAYLAVTVDAISGPVKDMKLITPKALIWLTVQGIVLIGLGLMCFGLTRDSLFGYAMGLNLDSPAANLLGIIILALPLIDLLIYLEKRFRPHLVIEMKHEMIIDD